MRGLINKPATTNPEEILRSVEGYLGVLSRMIEETKEELYERLAAGEDVANELHEMETSRE